MGHNTCKSMGRVLCVVRRHLKHTKNVLALSLYTHALGM